MDGNRYRILQAKLMEELDQRSDANDAVIREIIDTLVLSDDGEPRLTLGERVRISRELFASVRRLDILQDLIDDKSVTEIMVNGPNCIFIERDGHIERWNRTFQSDEKLMDLVQTVAGACNRVINEQHPIVDARLADGSRVNAVISPVALDGPYLTIRQFPEEAITMEKLVGYGSLTEEAAAFLEKMVQCGYSIVIGGGTSAGKTTFLNALSNYIPGTERIVTIEDNAELQIQGIGNLVRLEAKEANHEDMRPVTIRDLIK